MIVALLCLLSQSPAGTSQPDPALIRVYIDTKPGLGDTAALAQSAKDLTAALARQKKLFTIVEDEDKADVALEVQDRTLTTPKIVIGIGSGPTLMLAIGAEVVCAGAVALGLFTRFATLPLVGTMLVAAFNTKDIAAVLSCSTRTVEWHRANIRRKLKLRPSASLSTYLTRFTT